jgi:hypothetical protein
MNVLAKPRIARRISRLGRRTARSFELFRGEVFAMSPETVNHAEIKGAVKTLKDAIKRHHVPAMSFRTG